MRSRVRFVQYGVSLLPGRLRARRWERRALLARSLSLRLNSLWSVDEELAVQAVDVVDEPVDGVAL